MHLSMVFAPTFFIVAIISDTLHKPQRSASTHNPINCIDKTLGPTLRCCEGGMEEDGVSSPSRPQGQKGEKGVPIKLMSP